MKKVYAEDALAQDLEDGDNKLDGEESDEEYDPDGNDDQQPEEEIWIDDDENVHAIEESVADESKELEEVEMTES